MINKLFIIQLMVSLVAGGGFMALLTIGAARVKQRIVDIIPTFHITGESI